MLKNYLKKLTTATTQPTDFSKNVNNFWTNNLTLCLLAFFGLFGMTNAFGQTVFTDNTPGGSETFTVPAGVTEITVGIWGSGGGGGGSNSNNNGGSGGGGGGASTRVIAVTPGDVFTYTVGTGGAGGGAAAGTGANGTATTFVRVALGINMAANGGTGGQGNMGTAGTGGTSSGGTTNVNGLNGTVGNNSGQAGGNSGTVLTIFGAGGAAVTNSVGNPGVIPGGGGGGGERDGGTNRAGGAGANGQVLISYFINCSGAPTAGTATPATQTIILGNTANLSLTGYTNQAGITFQWQQSASAGGPFVNVTGGTGGTTANYTTAALSANTYYQCIVTCTNSGLSATSSIAEVLVSNEVLVSGAGINNVPCGENAILKDHAGDGNYGNNRNDYSVINAGLGATITLSGTYNTEATFDVIRIYDGAGIGGAVLATFSGVGGTINYTGNPGQTLTVGFTSDGSVVNTGFVINVTSSGVCFPVCTNPTAQPTALNLVPSGNNISGAFTAASPAADSYLVLISTNPAPPAAPVNGTTYAIGSTYQVGYTVVDNDSNTNFNATGLLTLTTYYFYIYSFNGLCTGGPLYLGTSPLTGNATTLVASYCTPTSNVSTRYIDDVLTVGNITNINNLGTNRAATGYADYTATTPVTQIPGGGVAIDYRLAISRQFVKIWVDWNNDGTFTDAAPELVYTTGGVQTIAGAGGFVVPPATLPGNYRIRIRSFETSQTFGPCGNLTTGEAEDYTLTVVADCPAKPNALYDGERCGDGTVVLGVEGTPGVTEFRFYDSLFGGTLIGTAPAAVGVTNWTTPALAATTSYYVTAFNGVCESWYRQEIVAVINPVANVVVTPSVPEVCGENNIVQISAGGDFIIDYLVNEDFESGGFGVLNRVNVAANVDTQWTNRTGPYVPTGAVWKPAITSKAIGNMFVVANSDFANPNPKDTQLRTANLDASAFSDLYLSFRHYFSYYPGEPSQFADVDVSTNGGGAWTNIARYTSNQGYAGEFANVTIDLSAYAGLPQVMVRFRFNLAGGSAWADGWALDDVKVYGTRPLNTTFTWSGATVDAFIDAGCTIPYVAQAVTTVYVRPTALQLASPSWSFTATATLGNGCPISEFIEIFNKTKLWKGTINDDWFEAGNWEPVGVPDINTCVFIYDGPFDANVNNASDDAFGKTLTVRPSGFLQVQPNNTLTIDEAVTVDAGGTFNIENSGSLIQNANVANTGIVTMRRNVNIRRLDYVYWSSPMAAFALNSVSPATTGYKWKWEPTLASTVNNHGNWVAANETMVRGKGYIVRGPDAYTATLQNYTANFVGTPNNGTITMPVLRGTYNGANYNTGLSTTLATANDDNWNLLGNPYPSAISADAFLGANANLAGFIKIWTHGTLPSAAISDPFYEDFMINYTVADYITYNALGGTQSGFDGSIAAGQGFFALMNHASASTSENVTFNNTMRSNAYRNDLFYRNSNVTNALDKSRIWLNLVSPTSMGSTTLIGYAPEATNGLDRLFDAPAMDVKTNYELYSLSNTDRLCIQGRALPFDQNDEVPLGMTIATQGIHRIAISNLDGLFADVNQTIYLEDKLLNVIHNLRVAPYSFTTTTGKHDNRFVLRFTNETLGNDDFITTNGVKVYTNNTINVTASSNIKSVTVYDVLGRTLGTVRNVNNTDVSLNGIAKTQSALVVIVELENGVQTTQKVIF